MLSALGLGKHSHMGLFLGAETSPGCTQDVLKF